jgi:hypothetical protein
MEKSIPHQARIVLPNSAQPYLLQLKIPERGVRLVCQGETSYLTGAGRRCARICARMTLFLLSIRDLTIFAENRRFSLVRWLRFAMKSDVLKSMISQS